MLSTIVRNAARNARRRHHNAKPHVDVDDAGLTTDATPERALDDALTAAQLEGCMAKLGEVHRHVVTLRVLEELSGDEAAAALGVTPGTSRCCCIVRASSSKHVWLRSRNRDVARERAVDHPDEECAWTRADGAAYFASIDDEHERRHRAHVKLLSGDRIVVDVDLLDVDASAVLLCDRRQNGIHHAARAAPFRSEVVECDHDR